MKADLNKAASIAAISVVTLSGLAFAATISVTALGEDGWDSGDTRAAGYQDIHGDTQVVSGRDAIEDALIADRLGFATPPSAPPLGNGALRLNIDGSEDKATLASVGRADPFAADVEFQYAWLVVGGGEPTVAAPAIKIGIDTSEPNGTSGLSMDRGEHEFDKILVYEPYLNGPALDDTWTEVMITSTEGLWWLVNLNATGSSLPRGGEGDLRTLDQWITDFSAAGLGGATIASLQVGIGSGNPAQESYVDYLIYSNPGQGTATTWDFDAPSTAVPTSNDWIGLILTGLVALTGVWTRRISRTASD